MRKIFLLALLASFSVGAFALSTDKEKAIEIRADKFNGDEVKQTAIYSGNVTVNQGSTSITGTRLELRLTPKGYRQITISGKPSKFKQQRDPKTKNDEEWIHAEADVINYDEETDVITLNGNAKLARTENGVEKDLTQGSKIVYDLRFARSVVEGGKSERVTTIIAPRTKSNTLRQTNPDLSSTTNFSNH